MKKFTFIVSILATVSLYATNVSYKARAYDLKTGKFVYSEHHKEIHKGKKHVMSQVLYRGANGSVIARKNIDYSQSKTAPSFQMVDLRQGYIEGVKRVGSRYQIYARKNKQSKTEKEQVAIPRPAVIDAGFHAFIKQNWQKLITGKKLKLNFAVPARQDFYGFEMSKLKTSGDKVWFRISISSMFLKIFAEPIDVAYSLSEKKLLEYRGLSNIPSNGDENYRVRILFDYN